MTSIPQNPQLIKNLDKLIAAHRPIFGQERVYQRIKALIYAVLFGFGRMTLTQLLMPLGLIASNWSAWYRLFSRGRFDADQASAVLFEEVLQAFGEDEVLVVGGDGTQTPRTSRRIEGTGFLKCGRTPPFKVGIHRAQRWFNFSIFLPMVNGFSRALPLLWLPCFTQKSYRIQTVAYKEWQTAVISLNWLQHQLERVGQTTRTILMLGDGSYDNLNLWKHLPDGVTLLVRSAKNRVLYFMPDDHMHKNRKYGERAPTPQQIWQQRAGWQRVRLTIRGQQRRFTYRCIGPVLRKGASNRPLFLIVVRGQVYTKHGRKRYRKPIPYLVNASPNDAGQWGLPLPLNTLLEWAWQRWELEVCHRELKSNLGLGQMQGWNPTGAVCFVRWLVWCYSLFLLAGYRTWGLFNAPAVPTRWWRGSHRWSFNTLWRSYRAALWTQHQFQPLNALTTYDWAEKTSRIRGLKNSLFGSSRI